MAVQGYMNGQLTAEFGKDAGVASGSVSLGQLTNGGEGELDIKIWVPGASSPSDSTFVFAVRGLPFADDFEKPGAWGMFEEIVSPCYRDNLGAVSRTSDVAYSGQYSLLVDANQVGSTYSNHLIANQQLSHYGRSGRWKFCTRTYVSPETAKTGQTGPEWSQQNTRLVDSQNRTYTAGIQRRSSPFLQGPDLESWAAGIEKAPGQAGWEPFMNQALEPGVWYSVCVEADYDRNVYGLFRLTGGGIDRQVDLSQYKIAGEAKFSEEAFWLTLESENLFSCDSPGVFENKIYYDDVQLLRGVALPLVFSLTPAVSSGSSQILTVTYNAPGGYQTLDVVNALINTALDGRQACYLAYSRPSNALYIVADNGDATQISGKVMDGTGTVGNSQCTVALAGSLATGNGNTFTLVLNLSFSASFTGHKVVYAAACDLDGNNSGWQTMGVHAVPPLPATFPNPTGLSPSWGNTLAQTITFSYQDQSSATNLQTVWALINTAIDGREACYVAPELCTKPCSTTGAGRPS